MSVEDVLPRFNSLVAELTVVGEAVDGFDLRSGDEASGRAFNELGARYREVAIELIEHCFQHRSRLLFALDAFPAKPRL